MTNKMSKGEFEQIIQKLKGDVRFIQIYNVTLENEWKDSFFIRVKRKEKPMDKLVYDPDVFALKNYNFNFCYEIRYSKGFLGNVLSTYPVRHLSDNSEYNGWPMLDAEIHYQTIYLMGKVDVDAIKTYILNMDWEIMRERDRQTTYIPSNGFLCDRCKCQISKSAYN
jgi:hypothetical protein